MEVYEAKHSYKQVADSVLTFNAGDTFYILGRPSEKWWFAKRIVDNVFGYVPAVYLQPAKEKVIGKLVPENRKNSKEYDIHMKALAEIHKKMKPLPGHVIENALAMENNPKRSSKKTPQKESSTETTSPHHKGAASQPAVGPSFHHSPRHQSQKLYSPTESVGDHQRRYQSMKERVPSSFPESVLPPHKSSRREDSEGSGRENGRKHHEEDGGNHPHRLSQERDPARAEERSHSEKEEQHQKSPHRRHSTRAKEWRQTEKGKRDPQPKSTNQTRSEQEEEERYSGRGLDAQQEFSFQEHSERERQGRHSEKGKGDHHYRYSDRTHSEQKEEGRYSGRDSQPKFPLQEHSDRERHQRYSEKGKEGPHHRYSDQTVKKREDHHCKPPKQEPSGRDKQRRYPERGNEDYHHKSSALEHSEREREDRHSGTGEDQQQKSPHRKHSGKERKHSIEEKVKHPQYEMNNNIVLAPWSKSGSRKSSSSEMSSWHLSGDETAREGVVSGDDSDAENTSSPEGDALSLLEDAGTLDTPVGGAAAVALPKMSLSLSGESGSSSESGRSSSVLASRKMASMENEGDLPEHLQNFPSPPLLSPPPPDYDLDEGAFTYTNGKPYHHKLNISGHPEGDRIPIPEENEDEGQLIKPKPLVNPCVQSRGRMDLHRELKHSGRKVLDKPELSKVFRDRKITEKKKEAEKFSESRRTSMEIKLMERQEMLEKEENKERLAKEGIVEDEGEASKPEFAKVKLRHTNASKT